MSLRSMPVKLADQLSRRFETVLLPLEIGIPRSKPPMIRTCIIERIVGSILTNFRG